MKIKVDCEAADGFELTSRVITPEGYLQAPATLARTGVQLYRAREFPPLVAQGVDPDRLLRIHRPAEEVFNPESMASFEDKPVIIEPHKPVRADNWKELAVGDVHGVRRDGDLLRADRLLVRDKSAVEAVMSGKKYLSNGYTFNMDLTPGTTAQGEAYDGIQRNIRGNHVAITDTPRGGPSCKIADSTQGAKHMTKVIIDGIPFEAEDALVAAVNKVITERDEARKQQPSVTLKIGDREKTVTGSDAIIKELTAKDTEITELRSKVLSPEQLDVIVSDRVAARVVIVGDALRLAPEYKPDGKTNDQVMRDVLTSAMGNDSIRKAVAEAVLGGKTVEAADSTLLTTAFKAVSAVGTPVVAAHVAGGDSALAAALTSTKEGGAVAAGDAGKPFGRDAFIARSKDAWKSSFKK